MRREILQLGVDAGEFREMDVGDTAEVIFSLYKSFIIQAYIQGEANYVERYMPCAYELVVNGIKGK